MLHDALADYNNPQLFIHTNSAGQLRRKECAWIIDQTITITYQLQGEFKVVSDRVSMLHNQIRKDCIELVTCCQSEEEMDFIFPEITRICNQDLVILQSWHDCVDWMQYLSPQEHQLLLDSSLLTTENATTVEQIIPEIEPVELSFYENLKSKSHLESLQDLLKFLIEPNLRQHHESYIIQSALNSNYKALAPSNWQEVPDLTVANLYWYFKQKENRN
jgi:hypothetical protein